MLCDSVLFNCFLATCRYLKLHAAIFFQPQYPTNGRIFARILFVLLRDAFLS